MLRKRARGRCQCRISGFPCETTHLSPFFLHAGHFIYITSLCVSPVENPLYYSFPITRRTAHRLLLSIPLRSSSRLLFLLPLPLRTARGLLPSPSSSHWNQLWKLNKKAENENKNENENESENESTQMKTITSYLLDPIIAAQTKNTILPVSFVKSYHPPQYHTQKDMCHACAQHSW